MGCLTSVLVVAATKPTTIMASASNESKSSNYRRQQASTRTSTASTLPSTSTSKSSKMATVKPGTSNANTRAGHNQSAQVFSISQNVHNKIAINAGPPPPSTAQSETSQAKSTSSLSKPTISSIGKQSTVPVAPKMSQANAATFPISRSNAKPKSTVTKPSKPKPNLLKQTFEKPGPETGARHPVRPRPLKWRSYQKTEMELASATPTTTTTTTPPATSSSSDTQIVNKNHNQPDEEAISIDKLLGMRIDSAKLEKILARKKSQAESITTTSNSKKSGHSESSNNTINQQLIETSKPTAHLTPQTSTDASWEFAFDSNHHLHKILVEKHPKQNLPEPLPIEPGNKMNLDDDLLDYESHHHHEDRSESWRRESVFSKSQHSMSSQFTATSYPRSGVSQYSMTSMNSHPNRRGPLLPPSQADFLQPTRGINLRQFQSDSMNNQLDASTTTPSTSDSISTQTKRLHQTTNRHLPEHFLPSLELYSKTLSFDSELQRKYSEVSQNFKSKLPPELPIEFGNYRRQSDQTNELQHRRSLADRRREFRKAQTCPNIAFDESEEYSSFPDSFSLDRRKRGKSLASRDNYENNPKVKSDLHSFSMTPDEGIRQNRPSISTVASHRQSPSYEISNRPPNLFVASKSPSFVSSRLSNRFESLLRHRSFLKTAASTVSSSFGGSSSRRGSEFKMSSSSSAKVLQVISDHSTGVNCLELSEDRSLLVSGGEDGVLRLWSTFSTPCECIGILVGHTDYITCATFYRLMVISGSADQTLKLWSIEDSNCLMTLPGHGAFINRVACYGSLLLSTSFDGTARIWTLTERITLFNHLKHTESVSLETVEDAEEEEEGDMGQQEILEKWKSTKTDGNLVHRQSKRTTFGQCLHVLTGHEKSVTQIALIATDATLLETSIIQELDIVITTSADGTARTWNLATGETRHILSGHTGPINCLALDTKEPHLVYTAGADWIIKCWDVITGEHIRDLKGHQNAVLCLISHNRILYSGSADNTVRAWAMEFGQCTRIYYRNTSSITCIQYFNGLVYTGSNDHSARLYDSNSGVLKQTYTGHSNAISALKVVSGKLFTASFDGKIIVWNVEAVQSEIDARGSDATTGKPKGRSKSPLLASRAGKSKATGTSRSKSGHRSKNPKTSTFIGPSLLNHTLALFAENSGSVKQNSREILYPQLNRKDSDDRIVNDLIDQVLNKKKQKRLSKRQKSTRRSSSASTSSSGNTSITCFGRRIWPEGLLSSLSSTSASSKSTKNHLHGWMDSSAEKSRLSSRKATTKVHRLKAREVTSKLNPSIRVLIEQPSDEKSNRNVKKGKKGEINQTTDDSVNVIRAINALEPFVRSFK